MIHKLVAQSRLPPQKSIAVSIESKSQAGTSLALINNSPRLVCSDQSLQLVFVASLVSSSAAASLGFQRKTIGPPAPLLQFSADPPKECVAQLFLTWVKTL